MKILFISSNFANLRGGVESVLEHITDDLSKNHTVKIISNTTNNKFSFLNIVRFFKEENFNKIKIKRIWIGMPYSISGWLIFPVRFLISLLRLNHEINKFSPDVINYHFPDDSSIYIASYIYMNPGIKLITNIHGNDVQVYAKKFLHRIFIGIILNKSQKIIVNSSYMKDVLISRFPEVKDKTEIIFNGIEYDKIQTIKPKKFTNSPYIFFVGRLVYKKGVDILLNSFAVINKEYPEVKLVIEGAGEELKNLLGLTNKLGLNDYVLFTKAKFTTEDKFSYMKSAEFAVMPSRIEPFGVVALELMASKLAVIASKTGGLVSIISDNNSGLFFESENIDDLTSKMKMLLDNNELRHKLAENANKAAKRYDWANIIHLYNEVFIEVTENK